MKLEIEELKREAAEYSEQVTKAESLIVEAEKAFEELKRKVEQTAVRPPYLLRHSRGCARS